MVFTFFTDSERYRLWQGVEAELDPRPGGIFRVVMTGRSEVVASGVYLEVDPPRRVCFTWGWEAPLPLAEGQAEVQPGTSTVEIDLRADGDATIVRLRHGDLPSLPSHQFHTLGWTFSFERLAAVCVGADPGPNPFPDF
jgi:uncharacterized protein YndB with AHSA1/START domain